MAIAHVQSDGEAPGSVSSDTHAYPSNVTAGNFLGCIWRHASGASFSGVTDSANSSAAWTAAGTHTQTNDGNAVIGMHYFPNTAGGACTVTITLSGAVTVRYLIFEFSGVATSSPQDGTTASAEGTGTALASGNMTPSVDGSVLICGGCNNGGSTFTAGTDFTIPTGGAIPTGAGSQRVAYEYFVQTTAASHDGTFGSGSVNWAAILYVFKPAAGGGGSIGGPVFDGGRTLRGLTNGRVLMGPQFSRTNALWREARRLRDRNEQFRRAA